MARTVVLSDIPEDRVSQVVSDLESEGANVSKVLQPDGKYTVTAVFPNGSD